RVSRASSFASAAPRSRRAPRPLTAADGAPGDATALTKLIATAYTDIKRRLKVESCVPAVDEELFVPMNEPSHNPRMERLAPTPRGASCAPVAGPRLNHTPRALIARGHSERSGERDALVRRYSRTHGQCPGGAARRGVLGCLRLPGCRQIST